MRSVVRRSSAIILALGLLAMLSVGGCGPRASGPNIVLVVLDTLRKDASGPGGAAKGLTPEFDRLAAEGTVFRNAWATAPWTVPSHASMFTGLVPSVHGCDKSHFRLDAKLVTLAEILGRAGYDTAAFFSNPWLSDRASGLLRGFAVRAETPVGRLEVLSRGTGDQGGSGTNALAAKWLDRRSRRRPFFLFINYLEPHLPYDPPTDYRKEHLADLPPDDEVSIEWAQEFNAGLHPPSSVDWSRVRRLYDGDAHTTDRLLGQILDVLKKKGAYEDSVIIVASDHGENLGEHDLVEHQFSLHETLLGVPLVIRAPARLPRGFRDDPIMLTDLFATVLDFAGIREATIPRWSLSVLDGTTRNPGREPAQARPVVAEYPGPHRALVADLVRRNPAIDTTHLTAALRSVRRGGLRLTVGTDGTLLLHDLDADPRQERNVAEKRPQAVKELLAILDEELPGGALDQGAAPSLDEETRERLRSLGYVR
jgi:arylsulfatase A-like enzyme